MSVKMRLTRLGDKKSPFYRIVITDSRKARDGAYIDLVGTFDPVADPAVVKFNMTKVNEWLAKGVQPTDTVRALLVKEGVLAKRVYHAKGVKQTPPVKKEKEANTDEAKKSE